MLRIQVPPTARIPLRPLCQLAPIATLPDLPHAALGVLRSRRVARRIVRMADDVVA